MLHFKRCNSKKHTRTKRKNIAAIRIPLLLSEGWNKESLPSNLELIILPNQCQLLSITIFSRIGQGFQHLMIDLRPSQAQRRGEMSVCCLRSTTLDSINDLDCQM